MVKNTISADEWLEINQDFLSELYDLTHLSEEKLIKYMTPLISPNKSNRSIQMKGCSSRDQCRRLVRKYIPTYRGTYRTGQRRKSDGRLRAQLSIRVVPMKFKAATDDGNKDHFVLFAFIYEHLTGLTFGCSLHEHLASAEDVIKITPKEWLSAFFCETASIMGSLPLKYQIGLPAWKLRVPREDDIDDNLAATFNVYCPSSSTQKKPDVSYTLSLEEIGNALWVQGAKIEQTREATNYGWLNPKARVSNEIQIDNRNSYPELDQFIDCPLPPSYYKKDKDGEIKQMPIKIVELKKYLGRWFTAQNSRAFRWMELQEEFSARNLWFEIILKNNNWKSEEIKDRKKRRKAWGLEASSYHADDFFPLD